MHGNRHHHHHQRNDLDNIMSMTSVFTIGPFVPCTPLCKIPNTPVMSICLVKQNDGTLVGKHQRFFYSTFTNFFYFCHVFYVFNVFYLFFSGTFILHIWPRAQLVKSKETVTTATRLLLDCSRPFYAHSTTYITTISLPVCVCVLSVALMTK